MTSLFEKNLMYETTLQFEILKYINAEQLLAITPEQWETIVLSLRMVEPDMTTDNIMNVFNTLNDAFKTMSDEEKETIRHHVQMALSQFN